MLMLVIALSVLALVIVTLQTFSLEQALKGSPGKRAREELQMKRFAERNRGSEARSNLSIASWVRPACFSK